MMPRMDWKQAIKHWRALPREEQRRIRLSRLPRKVARSMAFEGEPVELAVLRREHARLETPLVTSKHASAS